MAKVPVAGRVKTRLARQIGVAKAVQFYRATSASVVARLARQPFWHTYISVTPDTDLANRALPRHVRRIGQGGGDLGQRMQHPMYDLPPGPVCVIGTDIPGVQVAHIRRAFRLLGGADVVFGPAEDGGFWLVGMRRRPRVVQPYAGVRWSHTETLSDVIANLGGYQVAFTQRLSDVDSAADWRRLQPTIGRRTRALA